MLKPLLSIVCNASFSAANMLIKCFQTKQDRAPSSSQDKGTAVKSIYSCASLFELVFCLFCFCNAYVSNAPNRIFSNKEPAHLSPLFPPCGTGSRTATQIAPRSHLRTSTRARKDMTSEALAPRGAPAHRWACGGGA